VAIATGGFYPKQLQSKSNNIKEAEAINYSIDNNGRDLKK
jgi:hypothetical protein